MSTMKLSEPWYGYVKSRKKTAELRLLDDKRRALVIGQEITFTKEDGSGSFTQHIKNLRRFPSFCDAIDFYGYKSLMPSTKSSDEASQLYLQIPGYAEGQEKYGVLLIELE